MTEKPDRDEVQGQSGPRIVVIGVGGAGGNAIDNMIVGTNSIARSIRVSLMPRRRSCIIKPIRSRVPAIKHRQTAAKQIPNRQFWPNSRRYAIGTPVSQRIPTSRPGTSSHGSN